MKYTIKYFRQRIFTEGEFLIKLGLVGKFNRFKRLRKKDGSYEYLVEAIQSKKII